MAPLGLVTVMMERQGADQATLEAFLNERFPDNQALACVGGSTPLPSGRGLPHAVLVGVDGTVLWSGHPVSGEAEIDELIRGELRKRAMGFGATEAEIDVRKLIYGKEDYEKALAEIADIEDQGLRSALTAELEGLVERRLAAVPNQQRAGHWLAAQDNAKGLAKAIGRIEKWRDRAKELEASFKTKEGKAEIAAEKRYVRTMAAIQGQKDLPKAELAKALEGLLKKVAGTAQEARVRKLAAGAKIDL